VLVARTKALNQLKQKIHRGDSPINNGLEKLLAILGIDQAAYHRGNLNGKNVQHMFQESDKKFESRENQKSVRSAWRHAEHV
jgi:hypothetical protein